MKLLLSVLTSLSFASGVTVPIVTNSSNNHITPQSSQTVDLGGMRGISTDQGSEEWSFDFDLDSSMSGIRHIAFHGGGLRAYIGWGSDNWDYGWPNLDVIADGVTRIIFRDDHSSGLATQTAMLTYSLRSFSGYRYRFTLTFYTESYNSFSGCWGNLTIGNSLTLTD